MTSEKANFETLTQAPTVTRAATAAAQATTPGGSWRTRPSSGSCGRSGPSATRRTTTRRSRGRRAASRGRAAARSPPSGRCWRSTGPGRAGRRTCSRRSPSAIARSRSGRATRRRRRGRPCARPATCSRCGSRGSAGATLSGTTPARTPGGLGASASREQANHRVSLRRAPPRKVHALLTAVPAHPREGALLAPLTAGWRVPGLDAAQSEIGEDGNEVMRVQIPRGATLIHVGWT